MKLRKKTLAETSLEETNDPEDETSGPRREIGAPDLLLTGSIDRVHLERAIEQLPPGYKQVFVLHDIQGFEHNEIAGLMSCSIGNSKSQLHKARMRLRELLQETLRDQARQERQAAKTETAGRGLARVSLEARGGGCPPLPPPPPPPPLHALKRGVPPPR